jgi:hypothetical protein
LNILFFVCKVPSAPRDSPYAPYDGAVVPRKFFFALSRDGRRADQTPDSRGGRLIRGKDIS